MMTDNRVLVTNIQRFSLHDGPGIRTNVFLKGCTLKCPGCRNSENIIPLQQSFVKDGKEGIYGNYYSCDELYRLLIKDRCFWQGKENFFPNVSIPGGVTFSGGEPLMQALRLQPLWKRLKAEKIHTVAETSLFVSRENLEIAIKYIDLLYVDMKILIADECKRILGMDLQVYLDNLSVLFECGIQYVVRIPVIGNWTDSENNKKKVIEVLQQYQHNILTVELIKEHTLALPKYQTLEGQIPTPVYLGVSDEVMRNYRRQLSNALPNLPVRLCQI